MQKLPEEARFVRPPDIESMYHFIFFCLQQWQQRAVSGSQPFQKILNASKYAVITNSYGILDAVIHSYVFMNGFVTTDNEDNTSVYSKWKNFPRNIEGVMFKKKDILIIDEIRLLRNQIAHPKPLLQGTESEAKGARSLEMLDLNGQSKGFLNLQPKPEFLFENGCFLVNEVTRLLFLAEKELSNMQFLPKAKLRVREGGGTKWPKSVQVT